jgi:hypothetical protein
MTISKKGMGGLWRILRALLAFVSGNDFGRPSDSSFGFSDYDVDYQSNYAQYETDNQPHCTTHTSGFSVPIDPNTDCDSYDEPDNDRQEDSSSD